MKHNEYVKNIMKFKDINNSFNLNKEYTFNAYVDCDKYKNIILLGQSFNAFKKL